MNYQIRRFNDGDTVITIDLSYAEYCALDSELFDALHHGSIPVQMDMYNHTTTIYRFYSFNNQDWSEIWINDSEHTITVFSSTGNVWYKFWRLPL